MILSEEKATESILFEINGNKLLETAVLANICKLDTHFDASHIYEKALISHPFNAVLHSNISCILLRLNRIDEADKEADLAIQLRPDWPEAYISKAEALWKNGLSADALVRFCNAIRLEEKNMENIQKVRKRAIDALDEFPIDSLKALDMDNSGFMIVSIIGILLARQGHWNEATQILTSCLQMKEGHPRMLEIVVEYLATTYFKLKNYRKSIAYYEQLLETSDDEKKIGVRRNIAMAAEASHDFQLAIIQRRRILESENLAEDDAVYETVHICELLLNDGQPEKALNEIKTISQQQFCKRIYVEDMIRVLEASAYMIQGRTAKCLSLLENFQSDNSEVMIRCLESVHMSLVRDGRIDDCIRYVTEIIQIASERADFRLRFKATLLLAKSNANKRKFSESLVLTQSLLTTENQITPDMLKDVHRTLMEIHEKNKNWSSALASCKKLLEKCERVSVDYVNCCLDISRFLKNLPQMQQQQKSYLMMAVESSDLCAHLPSKVLSRSALIRFLVEQGLMKEAEGYIDVYKDFLECNMSNALKAIIIADLTKMNNNGDFQINFNQIEENPINQIFCSIELAEAEMKKRNYERAEALFKEGLESAMNVHLAEWVLKCFVKLSNLYMIVSDFPNCLLSAGSGLRLADLMNDSQAKSEILCIKSRIYLEKNMLEEAIQTAKKGMAIAEKDNIAEERIRCYKLLKRIFGIAKKNDQVIKYEKKLDDIIRN
ncbi:unnamed protein product [Auanema sp. JU1783]|nr:unnamed protein product [Auanema sp. JU1783]